MTTGRIHHVFQDLEQGAGAVASSRRLARQASQRYAHWKIARGARAWPTPDIRVLDDWLTGTWRHALSHRLDAPRLLSEEQELLLWEQIIRRRGLGDDSRVWLQLAGMARAARRTWWRIHAWQLGRHRLRAFRSADTEAFMDWAESMRRILDDRGWLTPAELPGCLADHADAWLADARAPMWWMGFDVLPPAHQRLMDLLADSGHPQRRFDHAGFENAGPALVECGDSEAEWHRAARWARVELERDPDQALGIVYPDLSRHRDRIEEILDDVLHPDPASRKDAPRSFHLSLGRPLSEYPVVNAALDLLRCTRGRIPFDVVSRLLRSPYLAGAADEWAARARFELTLREQHQETFSLKRLADLAGRETGLARLQDLLSTAAGAEALERSDPAGWAARFTEWLRLFGWPGERSQNSHEFQTVAAWRELLSSFAALAAIENRWSGPEAVKRLASMAAARVLQFHDDQAPLQVMGAAEAAGLWFDKLWLADMSDALWPPPVQPDPFIPVVLQKACGLPEASAETVLARARTRTANLLAGAAEVTVSFASREDEAPAALSPLFSGCRNAPPLPAGAYPGRVVELLADAPPLERIGDDRAPPLAGDTLRGGVNLVADQARCPFQAMAHHRLAARGLPDVSPGLSASERGKLVHQVARALWARLGDSEALHALDGAARRGLASACVSAELERCYADSPFQRRFLEVEAGRLTGLFVEWLALEARRAPFRVAAVELDTHVILDGVALRVRVDRIDELADGRRLILDYKTGRQLTPVRGWIDPRMEEPQLPMYALSVDEPVAGLALAGIRRGRCELRGVGEGIDGVPGLKPVTELGRPDMETLEKWWGPALGRLVAEHRRGVAGVAPKNAQTCRLCDAMSLCRIFERGETLGG